jgi:hypothetical protein
MLRNRYLTFITLTSVLLCLTPHLVSAEQLLFKKSTTDDGVKFEYAWLDAQNKRQTLSFEIPSETFENAPLRQTNYKPKIAQRHVTVALLKEARTINPKDAKVQVKPMRDAIDIKVKGFDSTKVDEVLQHLRNVQQNAYDEYLHQHYFTRFTTLFNQQAIKPDHLRYIAESVKPMVPASQAFYEKVKEYSDSRAYFGLLLSWLQSIPYDTLEDRVSSNGSGFAPPIGLLMQNLGDCDSKAVLASSMVRAFLPSTKMIMVFLPNHALLGIALTPRNSDYTLEHEGQTYVLYDPTGPAQIPFGQVSEDTERYISTARYQIEMVD